MKGAADAALNCFKCSSEHNGLIISRCGQNMPEKIGYRLDVLLCKRESLKIFFHIYNAFAGRNSYQFSCNG